LVQFVRETKWNMPLVKKSVLQPSNKEDAEFVLERDGLDRFPADEVLLRVLVKAFGVWRPTIDMKARLLWLSLTGMAVFATLMLRF